MAVLSIRLLHNFDIDIDIAVVDIPRSYSACVTNLAVCLTLVPISVHA